MRYITEIEAYGYSEAGKYEGIKVKLRLYENRIEVANKYSWSFQNLEEVITYKDTDVFEVNKNVIGRSVIGALIFGPVGAIVGGMSGIGTKSIQREIAVISFKFRGVPPIKFANYANEYIRLREFSEKVLMASKHLQPQQQIVTYTETKKQSNSNEKQHSIVKAAGAIFPKITMYHASGLPDSNGVPKTITVAPSGKRIILGQGFLRDIVNVRDIFPQYAKDLPERINGIPHECVLLNIVVSRIDKVERFVFYTNLENAENVFDFANQMYLKFLRR